MLKSQRSVLVNTGHVVGQCWLMLKSQGGSVLADTEVTRWVSAGLYTGYKVDQCWLILKSQSGSVLADTEVTRWVSAGFYWSQGGSVLVYTGHKVGQCWFILFTRWVSAG